MKRALIRFWIPLLAFVIIFSLGWAVEKANAAEDKRHCVTDQEWNRLHVHMDKAGVHRLLDGGGHHNYPNTRWYRICGHGADWRVIVWYRNGHLHNAYYMYSSTGYIDAKVS